MEFNLSPFLGQDDSCTHAYLIPVHDKIWEIKHSSETEQTKRLTDKQLLKSIRMKNFRIYV